MIYKLSIKILRSKIQEKKCKILIVFDDIIVDMISKKYFI